MLARQMDCLGRSSDYTGSARTVINAVVFILIRFLEYRMDVTRGHDRTGAYLFADTEKAAHYGKRADDKRDQFEKALQLDCFQFLKPIFGPAAKMELSDVASGRADIAIEMRGLRLVIEVKREDIDGTHAALVRKYGDQSTEYSNTNVRVGILLVLDRSRTEGTSGHLTEKFSVHEVLKQGDPEPRLLVLLTMPGKRARPSDLGPLPRRSGAIAGAAGL